MPNDNLKEYVRQNLASGYSQEQIKAGLRQARYTEREIAQAFGAGPTALPSKTAILIVVGVVLLLAVSGLVYVFWPEAKEATPAFETPARIPTPLQSSPAISAPESQAPQVEPTAQDLSGEYSVTGTNPDGSTYSGTLTMTKSATGYDLVWRIGSATQTGSGTIEGNRLKAKWNGNTVLYLITPDGRLSGVWAVKGRPGQGKETLTLTQRIAAAPAPKVTETMVAETPGLKDCGTIVAASDSPGVAQQKMDCMLNAVDACTPAKLVIDNSIDLPGTSVTSIMYHEIRGGTPGACIFYQKALKNTAMPAAESKDAICTLSSSEELKRGGKAFLDKCAGPLKETLLKMI
jgi:hypothetical protein